MAEVYYGENKLGKGAAVKVLKAKLRVSEELCERFELEARVMARLSHPNIRGVIDIGEIDGLPAIVMEYLSGQDLGSYVKEKGALPVPFADLLWIAAVKAIRYAHSMGVIHRDIKPSNFFITDSGDLKLLDFGIAKVSDSLTQTMTGQQMGTLLYMSPEQVKDPKRVGKETDYYSLGVSFYHLLTGRQPYDVRSESGFQIQLRIVQESLDLSRLPGHWPALLEACLRKNPVQRVLQEIEDSKGRNTGEETVGEAVNSDSAGVKGIIARLKGKRLPKTNLRKLSFKLILVFMIIVAIIYFSFVWIQWYEAQNGRSGLSSSNRISPTWLETLEGNLVYVEGGTYRMGCTSEQEGDCEDDEKPVQRVTLSGYYLGKYEVTQSEWRMVMGNNSSSFGGCDQCPVEQVSWDDIQEFMVKLNGLTGKRYRLPTEAEWEYAARGGSGSKGYKYSGSNNLDEVGWYGTNAGSKMHPVGQKLSNELGIYDMSGNVWEWCSDWYGDYSDANHTNPSGSSSGTRRVLRGGGLDDSGRYCRVSFRHVTRPSFRNEDLGFRLAL